MAGERSNPRTTDERALMRFSMRPFDRYCRSTCPPCYAPRPLQTQQPYTRCELYAAPSMATGLTPRFTSPHHAPMPNHLPTLIVTPHGAPFVE